MDRVAKILWVVGLGVGLHLAYGELSQGLAERFPQMVAVAEPEEPPAPLLPAPETAPEIAPPPLLIGSELIKPALPLISMGQFVAETPPELREAVDFWKKIYSVYDSDQAVIHDSEDLGKIYRVLDFRALRVRGLTPGEQEAIRQNRVTREMEQIKEKLDPEAGERLRSQTGLADKFVQAIRLSGRYLPHFEQIFLSHGLPTELTRLAFVESLFQDRALSRVGAAGLWQIMPSTGRTHGLKVSRFIDERFDPLLATRGAASLLRKNYEVLGNWPLAITAYNTGTGAIKRAVGEVGVADIGVIASRFRGSVFGFASRNFYAEFLAALDVYENAERYFGTVDREPPLEYEIVTLPVSITFPQIAFLVDTKISTLEELNPAYAPTVFEGDQLLASGSELRVPPGKRELFASRFLQFQHPGSPLPASFAGNDRRIPLNP